MGAYPSTPQWYADGQDRRSVPISPEHFRQVLVDVEGIVKPWIEIIENMKTCEKISLAQEEYLLFEVKETERKWTTLIQSFRNAKEPEKSQNREQVTDNEERLNVRQSGEKHVGSSQQTEKDLVMRLTEKDAKLQLLLKEQDIHTEHIRQLKKENDDFRLRFSKLASELLVKDNPNIADLSDENRPTKLGDIYSELYDNEYTDSQEVLIAAGYTHRESVDILRETLMNTFIFCTEKSTEVLTLTENALKMILIESKQTQVKANRKKIPESKQASNTMVPGMKLDMYGAMDKGAKTVEDLRFALKWKPKRKEKVKSNEKYETHQKQSEIRDEVFKKFEEHMKTLRKQISISMISTVQEAYFRTRWDSECIVALKPFIEKCLFVSWMMNVQLPPMAFLECPSGPDETLKVDQYKHYTKRGDLIDFIVWPTMLLCKGGPVIVKGVAQGK